MPTVGQLLEQYLNQPEILKSITKSDFAWIAPQNEVKIQIISDRLEEHLKRPEVMEKANAWVASCFGPGTAIFSLLATIGAVCTENSIRRRRRERTG
jgi:hypothetical protein